MNGGVRTPVVLFIYRRPDLTEQVMEVLHRVQPAELFVAADGPRPERADDAARCAAARAVVDEMVDSAGWTGRVSRDYSTRNFGSDQQITRTLDRVFTQVDRAIVIEDDILAHPHFFSWCDAMLDRYDTDPVVQQVSGRNELGRWDTGAADHFLACRGSIWGWATWADAWQRSRTTPAAAEVAFPAGLDPLVAEHLRYQETRVEDQGELPWDHRWTLSRILNGGLSVMAPVNLIRNIGFGDDASHTIAAGDLRAALPIIEPDLRSPQEGMTAGTEHARPAIDSHYDRWSLMLELMASYHDPAAACRLSRFPNMIPAFAGSETAGVLHHLWPFREPVEASALLDHVKAFTNVTPRFEELAAAIHQAVSRQDSPTKAGAERAQA
jgi:hypothetical protein